MQPNLFSACLTCVWRWQCILAPVGVLNTKPVRHVFDMCLAVAVLLAPVGVLNAAEPVRRVFDMCLAMAVHIGSSWCVECQTCLVVAVHIDSSWFMYTPP